MTFLPVVDRELRIGARRASTYWTRTILGGGVCLIWFLVLSTSQATTPTNVKSVILFWTVTLLAMGYCLLSGAFLTADCVSGEKRDGTLGLLFLTDLESYDVVFGKMAATSLHAVYGLLCVLPSLALCLLLGGVTMGEFWRTTAVLVVTMFLSLTIGLAVSVLSREARQTMIGTMGVIMGLAGIPPLLWWLAKNLAPQAGPYTDQLLLFCPPFDLALASDKYYNGTAGAWPFWKALIAQTGIGGLALFLAGRWVPRVWNAEHEASDRRITRWERWVRLGSRATQNRRRKLIESNPFCWLSVRDRLPTIMAWVGVLVFFVVWAAFLAGSFTAPTGKRSVCFITAVFMGYGGYVLWKSFVAIEAARRISEDRQTGALELLLVTKVDVESMLDGQRRALKRMFLGPGLIVLCMNVVMLGMVAESNRPRLEGAFSPKTIFIFGIGAVCVAGDLSSLSHAGTWIGLKARRLQYAFLGMLGRVMLIPWLGIAVFAVILITGAGLSPDDMYLLLFIWMFVSLAGDCIVGVKSRKQLEKRYRLAASGDFDALVETPVEEVAAEEAPQVA